MQLKYLKNIHSPKDIRDFTLEQLQELCDEIRNYTIETVTAVGGHLAPTLGAVELTVALHHVFDTPKDKLVWDVGHQAYAHKILTGRFSSMNTIRQFGGLSGFLKRTESEYDVFGAGHASTSISAALGVAAARDQKNQDYKVASVIGDGSLTGGLAYEGLNNSGILNTQILVVLNDNEMSISPNVGAMSKYLTRITTNPLYNKIRNEIWNITDSLPWGKKLSKKILHKIDESLKALLVPGVLFNELGFRYFGPIDGHDINELVKTLNNIKNINQPVLLHIITKKGKGLVSTREDNGEYHRDAVKFHAVKPNSTNGQLKKSTDKTIPSFQDVFGYLSCEVARNRDDTICITAAMREGTGLVPYAKEFPNRYYDVGIAEGHGVTFSAGFATEGLRPIVAIYSTFLQRAFDHIVHDVAIQHLPVIFCMDRAGIAGEDGPTHHGSLDIAYLRCIQDMVVSAPRNGNEFRHLLYSALNQKELPFSIRYPKSSAIDFDLDSQAELLPIGSWEVLRTGSDIVVLAVGPLSYNVERVAELLQNENISIEIVNCRFIKPMDESYLRSLIERFNLVITIEEGVIVGGFGDGVSSWLLENNFQGRIKRLGFPDSFIQHGKRDELLSEIGLDENGIIDTIKSLVNTTSDKLIET
ncbi:MAG: 1-deoxy-D-xylulose-5-phosphate synthase [Candidatus Marinimicrobia bacterium]|nr:1-deoxy-D-xylulose-5-phosphate synthase [Candidatus Neomarinimicrobiota bacterium]|tara:strand:+ start:3874 stop:5799 length:1926 start_codon:yes stop_codon:yes gene_type:complete